LKIRCAEARPIRTNEIHARFARRVGVKCGIEAGARDAMEVEDRLAGRNTVGAEMKDTAGAEMELRQWLSSRQAKKLFGVEPDKLHLTGFCQADHMFGSAGGIAALAIPECDECAVTRAVAECVAQKP
jgi:hypothetical protein